MLKTRAWIAIVAAAALVLGLLSWYTLTKKGSGSVVEIVQDGKVLRTIDLDLVAAEYSFTVECPEGGSNTILVQPGRICVAEADCPDRICVHQGWLSDGAAPVVCMPHRLVLRLKDGEEADAVVR
ncbi:MAG: NusG domain II-containing protein [Oscillospiraceae bacterium]|nr:NusG domain II-containing protein [Oscillospiraceae bacterium]MBR4692228.1 NusG domain II-containing protein [Oscillospiraceae bacterium]